MRGRSISAVPRSSARSCMPQPWLFSGWNCTPQIRRVPGAAREEPVVVGLREHVVGPFRHEVVRVEEVEPQRRFQLLEQCVIARRGDLVPSHVRETRLLRELRVVEATHLGVDPPEAGQGALLAAPGHHLHPDADAQDGLALVEDEIVERGAHARFFETRHRPVERSNAGQDQVIRTPELVGRRGR